MLITKTGGLEMKLNAKSLALTSGILLGLAVFLGTIWLLIIGSSGKTISLLSAFYFGYQFSIGGAFVGLVWGFVDGAIGGLIFAFVYNFFLPKES
jgi:hypothetical protein